MKKILVLFHPLNEVFQYLEEEGDAQFAPHHFWLFDKLVEQGYEVDFVKSDEKTFLNWLGNKLRLYFLQQQVDTLRIAKDYDLIFVPYMEYSFLLNISKLLKSLKKPIVGLGHQSYAHERKSLIKKFYYDSVRYVYFKGMDSILYYSQAILERSNQSWIKGNTKFVDNFGIDVDFFDAYISNQKRPPCNNFIFSTGGASRDFDTLVKAFDGIDFDLKITTVGGDLSNHLTCEVPPNVHIDNSLPFGLGSTGKIRQEYYNALAVAVPLKEVDDYLFGTWGITVVLEGMAMGKQILSTYNEAYPFDIEKEKIGFCVDYGDVLGWKQAINYLLDHPEEVREMGDRAKYLSKKKYNYSLFSNNVIADIDRILNVRQKKAASVSKKLVKRTISLGLTASNCLSLEWAQYLL